MIDRKGKPERVSSWEVRAAAIVERQAAAHPPAGEVTTGGRTYSVESEPRPVQFQDVSPRDPAAYAKAVDALHRRRFDASPEELARLKRAVERHLDPDGPASHVERGPVRRQRNLSVPHQIKRDYRGFEKWLVDAVESDQFVPVNFGFWCAAEVGAGRVHLDRLGFSKDMIATVRAAINPGLEREPTFSPVQFLAVASGIDIGRIEGALEFLRDVPAQQEIEKQQARGAYLASDELDRCIDACLSWRIYHEPGAEIAAKIVRALFEEMNRCGVSKAELAERAGISEKTLDTWNHEEVAKRTPPHLPTIAACLEVMGLRLMIVPEAEILRMKNSANHIS